MLILLSDLCLHATDDTRRTTLKKTLFCANSLTAARPFIAWISFNVIKSGSAYYLLRIAELC